jgi:hypothetical protein
MNTLHKSIEVHSLLLLKAQRIEKGVHQIGFATPYSTPEIETFFGHAARTAHQPIKQPHLGLGPILESRMKFLKRIDGCALCSVRHYGT